MDRRKFLATGALGAAATSLAAPALAQSVREWKLVSAWPRNLPGPGVAAQTLADRITTLSGGRINVTLYSAGEIVPGNGVFDAVSEGTAELYHAVPAYWGSKSKGILLFGSQPFGLRADEQFGWMYHGGGQALYDEMYGRFGIKPFLCGNSGPQWAGWFKNEINSVEDLRGLRFRTTGIASQMAAKLGMAAEAMSGPAMFQALQTGALDAGEFIGPWTDSALGYYQVAPYYYWPGVGEPSSAEESGVNEQALDLSKPRTSVHKWFDGRRVTLAHNAVLQIPLKLDFENIRVGTGHIERAHQSRFVIANYVLKEIVWFHVNRPELIYPGH